MIKLGVNISTDTTGALRFGGKALDAMRYMGIPVARMATPLVEASDTWTKLVKVLADGGIRFIWTFRKGRDHRLQVAEILKFEKRYPGQTIGMEGPNEPDLNPVTFSGKTDKRRVGNTWSGPVALALTQALRNEIRAHPELKGLAVFAFNDWCLTEQRGFTSYGNTHIYPNGTDLTKCLSTIQARAKAGSNGKVLLGEWGYTTGASKGFTAISEAQQAANFARDIAFIQSRPEIIYACAYTLVDYPSELTEQNRFGLFLADWTPKPAADVFRAALAKS